MPRRTQMSIAEIDEIITLGQGRISDSTWTALVAHLTTEKERRNQVAARSRKPRKYEGDLRERNKLAARKYRTKNKEQK